MKKRDWWVLIAVVVLIAASFLLFRKPLHASGAYIVVISLDGEEYGRYPFGSEQEIVIAQENGKHNVVQLSRHGVHMESANCKNQNCVQQGEVTPENTANRALGGWIICLPNRVTVELIREELP